MNFQQTFLRVALYIGKETPVANLSLLIHTVDPILNIFFARNTFKTSSRPLFMQVPSILLKEHVEGLLILYLPDGGFIDNK